ncbi:hypothetical protein [Maricaulis salignorans]|uniref:hypothetical protein n=1 Tax=Maricaulis salignorans TaxID=144026 RepID=UPI003A950F0F
MLRFLLTLGVVAGTIAANASAQAVEQIRQRPAFELALGGFITDNDATIRFDSAALGRGTQLDFAEDLGFDPSKTVTRVDAIARLGTSGRHRLDGSYFRLSRASTTTLEETIQFGDQVFTYSADVDSQFRLAITKLNYTYVFSRGPSHEIGASVGVFVADVDLGLTAATLNLSEREAVTLPLPTFGLRGQAEISDRLTLKASTDLFFIETDDSDGSLVDLRLSAEYALTDNVALGTGYYFVTTDLEYTGSRDTLSLGYDYSGLVVFLNFRM